MRSPGVAKTFMCSHTHPVNLSCVDLHVHQLIAVAQVARKYRVLVISDEIYSELHHTGEHLSISKYYPEGTIVSGGLSKWCGAGGWRMGFWMFPSTMNWLRKSMLVMASETYTSVASPIQHAARRAFVLEYVLTLRGWTATAQVIRCVCGSRSRSLTRVV